MKIARVIGHVIASEKDANLVGAKLLIIQPVRTDGVSNAPPLIATDYVDAGCGELVFFVTAREASFPFLPKEMPTDASIIGVIDRINRS